MKNFVYTATLLFFLYGCDAKKEAEIANTYRSGSIVYDLKGKLYDEESLFNEQFVGVRIKRIEILSEDSDNINLLLEYHYAEDIPVDEVKIFVGTDMNFFRGSFREIEKGTNSLKLSLSLDKERLFEETGLTTHTTSNLRITFEHYAPEKYKGAFYNAKFFFPKTWGKKT